MRSIVRQQYIKLLPKLQRISETIHYMCDHLPDQSIKLETNIKPFKRAYEKMRDRKLSSLLNLSDLVRGRLYYSKNITPQKITNKLGEIFKDFIVQIQNKKETDYGLAYQGIIHIDMKFGNINFELQVLPIEFKPYKDILHYIYEILRNNNNLSAKQKSFLVKIHNKIYKNINERAARNRD